MAFVDEPYTNPLTGFDGCAESSLTVMKWNDVVADDSKYRPSIEPMRPFVKYGNSSSASVVP